MLLLPLREVVQKISAKTSSCDQHQSQLKEIKFLLRNSWNNLLVPFPAIVPVACGA
jgi:hypothetical protein